VLEELDGGNLLADEVAQTPYRGQGEEGVASQLEEVVVDPVFAGFPTRS
jgi:hypothetical protein